MADDFKYHIDHHASLVRPPSLDPANADVEIAAAMLLQRRLGLLAISDGEYRRRNDLAIVYDGVDGFGSATSTPVASLVGPAHAAEVLSLDGTPSARGRLTAGEAPLLAQSERSTMIALPSPGYLAALCDSSEGAALASIVHQDLEGIAADGVDYVLLRNPALGFLLTDDGRARAASLGVDADKTLATMLEVDSAVVQDVTAPEHFRVGLDLTTAGAATGPYDESAVSDFLSRQGFDRIHVDHLPSRPFPLVLLPTGLVVSLGVVDISVPRLEDVDDLVARIDEAAAVIDIDDIAVSTNGGFHAVPTATTELEHAKLQLVETTARYFWGNEL